MWLNFNKFLFKRNGLVRLVIKFLFSGTIADSCHSSLGNPRSQTLNRVREMTDKCTLFYAVSSPWESSHYVYDTVAFTILVHL